MSGHGWVYPNKDGSKARCGGPGLCMECSLEADQKKLYDLGAEVPPPPSVPEAKEAPAGSTICPHGGEPMFCKVCAAPSGGEIDWDNLPTIDLRDKGAMIASLTAELSQATDKMNALAR